MDVNAALQKYADAEFSYGRLDCCLFVANVIQDVTGIDYAEKWRGRYSTELGALRVIAEYGSLVALASSAFGQLKPFWSAKKGDPVLLSQAIVEQDGVGEALGVFDGDVIVYLTESGLAEAPISAARGCWNV